MSEVFSTPSYRRMMESQAQQLAKVQGNDIDEIFRIFNKDTKGTKDSKPEGLRTVTIGLKPEVVQETQRKQQEAMLEAQRKQQEAMKTQQRIHQKQVEDSFYQGFANGLLLAGLLVAMVLFVLFMP